MSGSISSLYLRDPEAASAMRRQQLAEGLMAQAQQPQHMTHPLQALGSMAQTLVGALMSRRADQQLTGIGEWHRAANADFMNEIRSAMGGGGSMMPAGRPIAA